MRCESPCNSPELLRLVSAFHSITAGTSANVDSLQAGMAIGDVDMYGLGFSHTTVSMLSCFAAATTFTKACHHAAVDGAQQLVQRHRCVQLGQRTGERAVGVVRDGRDGRNDGAR